jgi:hypothetical protein
VSVRAEMKDVRRAYMQPRQHGDEAQHGNRDRYGHGLQPLGPVRQGGRRGAAGAWRASRWWRPRKVMLVGDGGGGRPAAGEGPVPRAAKTSRAFLTGRGALVGKPSTLDEQEEEAEAAGCMAG